MTGEEEETEEAEAVDEDEVMVTPPVQTNGSAAPAEQEDLLA